MSEFLNKILKSSLDLTELEQIIHPCGFYKNKAKNIKLCAKQILEKEIDEDTQRKYVDQFISEE